MTRREFTLLLTGAWNEQSRALIRRLYARPRHRGERDRAKLAPQAPQAPRKSTKKR